MQQPIILIVDDDPQMTPLIANYLENAGMRSVSAMSGPEALDLTRAHEFDAAVIDLGLPGLTGMELIKKIKERYPDIEIIIFTGQPTLETSIEAIRESVFDYLQKPLGIKSLTHTVEKAVERRFLIRQNKDLLQQLRNERLALKKQIQSAQRALEKKIAEAPEFIGSSQAIQQVRHMVAEVAPTDMTVFIRGESGTGKDVVARLIHQHSGCPSELFVKINCPAIPETLLESELFGHERGAFTGSERKKPGRFELAQDGTIFMDEIGEIPMSMQVKLLQAIEHKEFTRLGGEKTISINSRILAATNADLEKMIQQNHFRADLYYRLNEYTINIPPLRDRLDDVPALLEHFLRTYCEKYNSPVRKLSEQTLKLLMSYSWPGNVREMEALIRRFALSANENLLHNTLNSAIEQYQANQDELNQFQEQFQSKQLLNFHFHSSNKLNESEIQTIMNALSKTHWNQREAAKNLGISYSTLRRRIAKYRLKETQQ